MRSRTSKTSRSSAQLNLKRNQPPRTRLLDPNACEPVDILLSAKNQQQTAISCFRNNGLNLCNTVAFMPLHIDFSVASREGDMTRQSSFQSKNDFGGTFL
jgi:hypothetical protein